MKWQKTNGCKQSDILPNLEILQNGVEYIIITYHNEYIRNKSDLLYTGKINHIHVKYTQLYLLFLVFCVQYLWLIFFFLLCFCLFLLFDCISSRFGTLWFYIHKIAMVTTSAKTYRLNVILPYILYYTLNGKTFPLSIY